VEDEEEDYYLYDEDDVCYDDDGDYEFDETDFNQQLADKFDGLDLPPGVEATVPWLQKKDIADGPSTFKSMAELDADITKKYEFFKQFDVVENFSDHHYADKPVGKTGKDWTKRIQYDWKLLEKDLPGQLRKEQLYHCCYKCCICIFIEISFSSLINIEHSALYS
jgi:ubiquitin-conjugating enzyme E2 O